MALYRLHTDEASTEKQCYDVSVLRSADSWMDHKLLRGKLKIRPSTKRAQAVTRKWFDVNGLKNDRIRDHFVEKAKELIEGSWDKVTSGQEMWETIRASMVDAAKAMLGWEVKPDWFKEKGNQLKEQIDKRNVLFQRWLRSNSNGDRQRYVMQRRCVNSAVKKAINEWMQEKARAVEVGMLTLRWVYMEEFERIAAWEGRIKTSEDQDH